MFTEYGPLSSGLPRQEGGSHSLCPTLFLFVPPLLIIAAMNTAQQLWEWGTGTTGAHRPCCLQSEATRGRGAVWPLLCGIGHLGPVSLEPQLTPELPGPPKGGERRKDLQSYPDP